jgi:DNA-binding CsgD family transcriptional regulator/Mrp family chromosome partitioning ATPase
MPEAAAARLVGREAELGLLTALLEEAAAGRPVVALVSGDAGVGKTRVIAELAATAAERGFTVLSGRCAELGDSVPYLPLADALRKASTGPSAAGLLLDALAARPVLSQLLPDRGSSQPDTGETPGLVQQQLFGAVLGLLSELAAAGPVLLVLEDLHWADRSTRDLLTFLSRAVHRERLALVVSYRTDDLYRRHPLRAVIAELLRLPSVTSVELGPLTAGAMAEHLSALSGGQLDAAALDKMIIRAEGNPYYAEELVAVASERDLPVGLAELLLARTERLSPAAQQVLRAAAVTGGRVDDELVAAASGLDGPEYEAAVREAVAHQLLVPDGAEGYAFRHALLREAIYADLLPGERTRLHARLAALLADERRLAEVPGTAAALAHHALASHDIPGAFAASVLAGHEAERLAAPAEAHRYYDQALSLWERVSDPEKLGGVDRGTLALRSALSAAGSGDLARAVHQLRRLLGYLGDDSDPALISRANERLAYFLIDLDEEGAAVAAARAAVDALPAQPPRWERARALATQARAMLWREDEAVVRAKALRAMAEAEAADAPSAAADALVTLGMLSEGAGRVSEAVDLLTRAHREARSAGVLGVELRAAFHLARVHLERGDLTAASATAHEGVHRAAGAGLVLAPYGYDLRYLHYLAHFAGGQWDHAQELADGFATRVTSPPEARLSAMALFIDVARGRPSVAERRSWLERFWPGDAFSEYVGRGLLAQHALWQGDTAAAVAAAAEALQAHRAASDHYNPQAIRVAAVAAAAHADRARQARAAGREDAARTEAQAARDMADIARAGAADRAGGSLGSEGRGWLARAEAEERRASGEHDPAPWQAVIDAFGPAFVYETAVARWQLAEALAEAGRREDAQQAWMQAAEDADRLGAVPLQQALRDLARRARLAIGPAGEQQGSLAGLTSRELEVLRLLAAGQSNREIGAALFIATKTASVHVSHILAKLGAATRTEAAAIAHAHGLGMPEDRR